jgi:hypothetical protein
MRGGLTAEEYLVRKSENKRSPEKGRRSGLREED